MTLAAQLLPDLYNPFLGVTGAYAGLPLAGGSLYSYAAGTSTPLATYTDATGGTANTNPVVLNAAGYAPVWLGQSAYKFVLYDANGVLQYTVDNVNIINPGSIGSTQLNSTIAGIALALSGLGALNVQVDSATMQVNGSNQLAVKTISSSNIGTSSKLEVLVKNTRDLSSPGLYQEIPQYEWTTPSLLSNPGSIPGGAANQAKWSPNGEFLAVASTHSPYVYVYQRVQTTLTLLSVSPGLSAAASYLAWSPCGDFLAAGGGNKSFVVLQRTGNSFSATAATVTSTINGSVWHISGIAWSPNSDFVIVSGFGGSSGNAICTLERSGTTFNDVSSSAALSASLAPLAWSPDSYLFGAVDATSGLIDMYSRADNVFSQITPPVVTSYANDIVDMAFSPDFNYFAVALSVSPYVLIFDVTANAFTQISNPASLPPGAASCIAWSANSEYLLVGDSSGTSPYMTIYSMATGTPINQSNPTTVPAGSVLGADWTSTKQFLAVASATTPYIQVYQTASTLPSNAVLWTREAPNV